MPIRTDYFESISKEIEGKFHRVNHLLDKANLKSGEYHEAILRQSLSNFLSNRFSVNTGYIWFDNKKQSRQIDIMVIDENCPYAYIFKEKDFVIVRPEAVVAVVEVKTVLKQRELIEAFNNIVTAIRLKHDALCHYGQIMGFVFGYTSNVKLTNDILDKWFKHPEMAKFTDKECRLWPRIIFFFTNGLFLQLWNDLKDRNIDKPCYLKLFRNKSRNDKAWQLSLMISCIVAMCEGAVLQGEGKLVEKFKSTSLIDFENARKSYDSFSPKTGYLLTKTK